MLRALYLLCTTVSMVDLQCFLNATNMRQWIESLPDDDTNGLADALRELCSEYHRHRKPSVPIDDVLRSCLSPSQLGVAMHETAANVNAPKVRSR